MKCPKCGTTMKHLGTYSLGYRDSEHNPLQVFRFECLKCGEKYIHNEKTEEVLKEHHWLDKYFIKPNP